MHTAITEDLQELIDCKYLSETKSILAHIQSLHNEALIKPLAYRLGLLESKFKSECVLNFDYKKFTLKTNDEIQQIQRYIRKMDDQFEAQDRQINKALLKFVLKDDFDNVHRHTMSEIANCCTVKMFDQLQEVTAKAEELTVVHDTIQNLH